MTKPSLRLAPAPPRFSGTQASVSPASDRALQSLFFQPPSRALLIVCGSARSAKIRAAVSATILSLSVVIAFAAFRSIGVSGRHRAVQPLRWQAGGVSGLSLGRVDRRYHT